MARKRKNNQNGNNNGEEKRLNYSVEEEAEPVDVEVDEPKEKTGFLDSLLTNAKDNLNKSGDRVKRTGPSRGQYVKKAVRQQQEEISNLLVSLLVLLVSNWNVPDSLKPSDDEIRAVSEIATRLVLRHLDIAGKLSPDILDLLGIVAVLSGWYARTAAGWREYRNAEKLKQEQRQQQESETDGQERSDLFFREVEPRPASDFLPSW